MKIWTEPTMERIIDTIRRKMAVETKWTNVFLAGLIMDIEGSATDTQEATLFGYRLEELAELAQALRRKGVSPEEVEDWHKGLAEMQEWMLREIKEAGDRAIREATK